MLSVLLFHVGFSPFAGGYIGVDVFFVISGFLITRLIVNEVKTTNDFSYLNFYVRRARRLMPALFATLLVTSLVGYILFSPLYFEQLGKSLVFSTVSLANFLFWSESGYFDTDAIYKPLLHTWSLSVEEQFYLIWPVFLVLVVLNRPRGYAPVFVFVASVISLAANLIFANGPPAVLEHLSPALTSLLQEGRATIFFLTPFRIFEFGIGALLVWAPSTRLEKNLVREALLFLGFALIGYAIFMFDESTMFPSTAALIPCMGTAFVILGADSRYLGILLRNPISVAIGLISYSLYLVHWPLIVFYSYQIGGIPEDHLGHKVVLCMSAVTLGAISYRFIEQPFRHGSIVKRLTPKQLALSFSVVGLLLILPGVHAWTNDGWTWRIDRVTHISKEQVNLAKTARMQHVASEQGCSISHYLDNGSHCGSRDSMQVLAFGNSHALDAYNIMFEAYGDRSDVNITWFEKTYGCDFRYLHGKVVNRQQSPHLRCAERADLLNNSDFLNTLDIIAFSAHKPLSWGKDLIAILNHMKTTNPTLKIVFFGAYIGVRPHFCSELVNEYGTSDACKNPKYARYFASGEKERIMAMPVASKDFVYIDKIQMLCRDQELQSCLVEADGEPAFYDGDHLALPFARLVANLMKLEYQEDLTKLGLK